MIDEQAAGLSLIDGLKGVTRRKRVIALCTAAGVLAGLGVLAIFKPTYQSEAQVLVENLQTPFEKANIQQADARPDVLDKSVVLSQVSVLKSADIEARVVDKLSLAQVPEFNPLINGVGLIKSLMAKFSFTDDPNLFSPQELALKRLDQQLTVYQIPDSNVIGIKYAALNKQVAADVANAVAETYVESTREVGASSNSRARDWLSQQIADLRTKVSTSENAVEKYRSEAGLLKGERTTLSTQQISEMSSQIVVAQTAAAEAEARVNEIKSMLASGAIDASSDVLNSPLIQSLKQAQVAAQRRLSELAATYLPNHPKMIGAQADLDNVNNQLMREALKIVDSLKSQAKVANARAASLKADLDRLKGQESDNNISDVKLQELQRNAEADRKLLETMLERYADVNARQEMNLQPGMARLIQKALPAPAPYFPKSGPILLLTSLAGLITGLGLAFLAEVIAASDRLVAQSNAVRPVHPAREALFSGSPIPNLSFTAAPVGAAPSPLNTLSFASALTPAAALAMAEQALLDPSNVLAVNAQSLAGMMVNAQAEKAARVFSILTVGSPAAPNAALASVATARALAAAKVKVIALDLSASAQAGFEVLFGLPSGPGVCDLVAGVADFTKVVARDPQSAAHVMRFGTGSGPGSLKTVEPRLGQVIEALSSIYSVIILHLGEASSVTPDLAANSQVAVILAPAARLKDAIAAIPILEQKGVKSTINLRLELQSSAVSMAQAVSA